MNETNGNERQIPSNHTQTPRPHKKAPWACLQCRSRKVRCDVSQTGNPCTRCRRNGESCLEHPSDQRTIMRRRRREAMENDLAMADYVKVLSPAHGVQPSSSSSNPLLTNDPLPSLASNDSSSHLSSIDSSATSVFYLNYQFLSVGNLQILLSGDIDYLELQGCFLVPKREILDDFVEHYFLHVHPLLPLFNEADFWKMYSQRGSGDATSPKISLLVFQALMFASCNFTSEETIKALGFPGIRQAKASFYRKAKLLFDFETESSPIAIAQAALLLSYRPSYATLGVKRPNTTWLTLAVQNAEIADAKHYANFQPNSPLTEEEEQKQQNTLKRLWWCCIIRDRVLPLCVRRNIQIDRSRFNFAANAPLRCTDVEDEIEHSKVYSPKAKRHLIRILEKFVELCVILTDVLALVYPLDERRHDGSSSVSDTSKIWRAKHALKEWEKDTASRLSDLLNTDGSSPDSPDSQPASHESITLYIHLIHMYYHSSWMALCHHEALGLTHDSSHVYNSMNELTSAQQRNQRELHNAASAVTNCLEKLNRLQLDRWLPSSAVACTATPLVLHILDVKLSSLGSSAQTVDSGSRAMQKHRRLKVLIDAMKTYHPQYDGVDFVVSAVRHIVDLVQLEGIQPSIGPATRNSFEWTDILTLNPSLYLRLALTIDLSLSKDRLAQELDFPPNLRGLFAGKLSPLRALIAQDKDNAPNTSARNLNSGSISDPSVVSSTMEEWLRWGHRTNFGASNFEVAQGKQAPGDRSFVVEIDDDAPATELAANEESAENTVGETFEPGTITAWDVGPLLDEDFNMEEFMGEMAGLAELDPASFVGDIIRAAMS